jgi:hypothetical protein
LADRPFAGFGHIDRLLGAAEAASHGIPYAQTEIRTSPGQVDLLVHLFFCLLSFSKALQRGIDDAKDVYERYDVQFELPGDGIASGGRGLTGKL